MRINPNLFRRIEPNVEANTTVPTDGINTRFKNRLRRETLMRGGIPIYEPPKGPKQFKTIDEHNNFYVKRLLDRAKVADPDKYDLYMQHMNAGNKDFAMSVLALLGGKFPDVEIPQFDPKLEIPQNTGPSRIRNISSGRTRVGGYRYNRGHGLPARASINKRRRRRK